jgi:hypothetical protein
VEDEVQFGWVTISGSGKAGGGPWGRGAKLGEL